MENLTAIFMEIFSISTRKPLIKLEESAEGTLVKCGVFCGGNVENSWKDGTEST